MLSFHGGFGHIVRVTRGAGAHEQLHDAVLLLPDWPKEASAWASYEKRVQCPLLLSRGGILFALHVKR